MIIRAGTICYGSECGHYNFYYPNFNLKYELTISLQAQKLCWVGYEGYQAVKITSPENYLPLNIVWIKTKAIYPNTPSL
jgi:hypothetical protein